MFKYDIPYAKPGQLSLLANGIPINVSKNKSYLIKKMEEQIDLVKQNGDCKNSIEYTIIDEEGKTIFSHTEIYS